MDSLRRDFENQMIEYMDPGEDLRTSYDQLKPSERYFVDTYTATLDPRLARRSVPQITRPVTAGVEEFLRRPMVRAAIAEIFSARRARYSATVDRMVQELAAIAFASHSDYMRLGDNGEPYYDLTGVSAEAMAAVKEITVEDYTEGRGPTARDIRKIKLALHDKTGAMALMAKLIGAVAPDSNTVNVQVINGGVGGPVRSITDVAPTDTPQQAAQKYADSLFEGDE